MRAFVAVVAQLTQKRRRPSCRRAWQDLASALEPWLKCNHLTCLVFAQRFARHARLEANSAMPRLCANGPDAAVGRGQPFLRYR